ncbi:MAG: carboxyl transferase domain-containing protein [Thermoleophilaceae bacterium]
MPDLAAGAREDGGPVGVASPFTGVVVDVVRRADTSVSAGDAVLVLESMKMHHEVTAPAAGVVRELGVAGGDQVEAGDALFAVEPRGGEPAPAAGAEPAAESDADAIRADLRRVLERRRAILDEARPDAVERRHAAGRRTARENVADLCDPGSFSEYGAFALAAQRARRSEEELIERTPADGMVAGVGAVNGGAFGADGSRCAVLAYDYTVLAGTQGVRNHKKADRLLDLAERRRLPVVLFADGGGGRPGDTDQSELFHLVVPTFRSFARLSGLVPRVGIASGNCFAGNAALLGCCDLVVATPEASIGMGGPAMIEGGGLGSFTPEEVGPVKMQAANGVIDVVADDDAAAADVAKRFLSYFQGDVDGWACADQRQLRAVVPEDPKRTHDARAAIELLADGDSVLELRAGWGKGIVTALARIEGRAVGVIANDPAHLSGAIDADGSDKAARFLQLCDAFGLPILSLVDTPGFMVGPDSEAQAMVRRCSRLFVAAATLTVPWLTVVIRRAYGLGAQAMAGGDFHAPLLNVAWPTGEFGAMGVEGAVRLALRRELEAIEDEAEREQRVRDLVAQVRSQSGALNMAAHFEIDDVIDPADTRARLVGALATAPRPAGFERRRTMVDTW